MDDNFKDLVNGKDTIGLINVVKEMLNNELDSHAKESVMQTLNDNGFEQE